MDPERWKQIDALLDVAFELEPGKRSAFLDEACAGGDLLRQEVEKLLAFDHQSKDFMDDPALQAAEEFLKELPASRLSPGQSGSVLMRLSLFWELEEWEKYTAQGIKDWNGMCRSRPEFLVSINACVAHAKSSVAKVRYRKVRNERIQSNIHRMEDQRIRYGRIYSAN